MIVRAADLRPEGLVFDGDPQLGLLTDEGGLEIGVSRALLSARLTSAREGLRCAGQLEAEILVPCARCLEPFPMSFRREFDLEYRYRPAPGREEHEVQIPRGDLDIAWLDEKGCLEVSAVAREQIYLELPMKPLCAPDCRGLCPRCGGNLNRGACACDPPG